MLRRVASVLAVVTLASTPAWGQKGNRDEIDRLEAERQDRARESEQLRAQARDASQEIERLRAQLVSLAQRQSTDEADVASQRARFDRLNARESELTARMSRNRAKLTRLLGALQLYTRDPPPALLVSPDSATDAVRAAILMRAVAPELERRADALKGEAEEINRLRREAALAGEALFTAESAAADRRAEIERLIREKSYLEARLSSDAETAEREARALAERVQDLGGLIQGLSHPGESGAGPGRLSAPVRGELIRRFGQSAGAGRSDGWTWRTERSAQVLAPAAGVVAYAGPLKQWGEVVILRMGGGYHVVVAGMDEVSARTGRSVAAGEPIGRMSGSSGPPPELYLEIRRNEAPVDPARWLDEGRRD
ncbi:murein hydrolase activator EnvC [Caulobacter sp. 17J80-11]|uniref:murein hydrolase activator EnvC family protein n=1 Tax=Caulobacter sp. 17J80-11 TaxID=2763502 RepID=UPI001653DAEF|nr:peptidoglycan DD-metalloendopeptidase family protein [Caulobacter sp. 17J80-11]MBC6983648.1 peptidoglycan DD-metalloendopeptidase family protein [Caulobacter sp. 17J80-11]